MVKRRMLVVVSLVFASLANSAYGFQVAPLGSKFEARLTNEPESRLARVAGKLGVLIKLPVHEEITQLGFGCPVNHDALVTDDSCKGGDAGFANHFVIYGVRWNDLPPFALSPGQGAGCKVLGTSVCRVNQTIRFSTQPDCWYCLFKEAEKKATSKKITGCEKGDQFEQGNLMTRSHFGDLQFLHAMARDEGTSALATQRKILDWMQFAWMVFSEEIAAETLLRNVEIPTIKEHFGCSNWSVSDIFILGRKDRLLKRLPDIAFGSILHTVQDSFAGGHATREPRPANETCAAEPKVLRPGRIIEFHTYGAQDGSKHDSRDSRSAMTTIGERDRWPEVIEANQQLFLLYDSNASWDKARPFIECVFEVSRTHRPASPGEEFARSPR